MRIPTVAERRTDDPIPKIVILGAGTGGTILANKICRRFASKWQVTVIDQTLKHYYQPGFLHYPFGKYTQKSLLRDRRKYLPKRVRFFNSQVKKINAKTNSLVLGNGLKIDYDILVIATGVRTAPEETPGLLGEKWHQNIFDFYSFEGALALRAKLAEWEGGRLVVSINEMPIKCPPAPLEFAFLADDYFRKRGMRDKVSIEYVTSLSGAFTRPKASQTLGYLLKEKSINIIADFDIEKVDQESDQLIGYDGRKVNYDLLVTVPVNKGDDLIARSGLGDELNLIPVDIHTLRSKQFDNIFVIGDAAALPTSKAGAAAHFQSDTVVANIEKQLSQDKLEENYGGHVNCFVETGHHKALLIDFDYQIEPQQGKYPFAVLGPMSLLKESYLNHLAKLFFRYVYWNWLMRGLKPPLVSDTVRMDQPSDQSDQS